MKRMVISAAVHPKSSWPQAQCVRPRFSFALAGRKRADKFEAPMFECPCCGSHDTDRIRRLGIIAAVRHVFGQWPYWCRACHDSFYAAVRRTAKNSKQRISDVG